MEIPLTQGQVAIIDADDFDRISQRKWYARWATRMKCFYAATNVTVNGKQMIWPMQNFILNIPPGSKLEGDHIDPSRTLDNRKSNLRVATRLQQVIHRRPGKNNKFGFKGVSMIASRPNLIVASIRVNRKRIHLGTFRRTEVEKAARVYDAAARMYFGEFAYLNFPDEAHA